MNRHIPGNNRDIIFECIDQGTFLRVTAFDIETKIEVCLMTPRSLTQDQAHRVAQQKLLYMLEKRGVL